MNMPLVFKCNLCVRPAVLCKTKRQSYHPFSLTAVVGDAEENGIKVWGSMHLIL